MTFRTVIDALTEQSDALRVAVEAKKETLDAAEAVAVASAAVVVGKQPGAEANAATAAAKATEATNNATQIAAYKTAAAALDTSTTATAAVTNLLPDLLAKKDPARHPFRKKMPTLVLDFERQKCHRYAPGSGFGETTLSSFMTFARNSTATYTGPDGLIKTAAANEARYDYDPLTGECKGLLVEEQRTNLRTWSASFSPAGSATLPIMQARAAVAPDGTLSATLFKRIATSASYLAFETTKGAGASAHTLSVFVKRGNVDYCSLRMSSAYPNMADARYNLATGTVISATASNGFSGASATIAAVGGGWYRITLSATTDSGSYADNYVSFSSNNIVIDGTDTATNSTGYVWGAQLEAGSFPTSYIPTPATFTGRASTATYLDANGVVQTAASGVARSNAYDYDSDGVLRPIGLLLEASATNQLLYSEQFDNAVWWKTGSSVTANAVVAPDGLTTADAFLDDATNVYHRVSQSLSVTAGSTYTYSTYVKAGAVQYLVLNGAALIGAAATFDLTAGTVSLVISGSASLQKLANGWFRCSVTGVAPTTQTSQCFIGFNTSNVDGAYIGSGQVCGYLWGAQLGVGNYPTSYIATTSAQVTRAADTSTSAQATRVADDAKVDGTKVSDFYNQNAGTLIGKMVAGACSTYVGNDGRSRGVCALSDGTSSNRIRFMQDAGKSVRLAIGGSDVVDLSTSEATSNVSRIGGLVIKKDAYAFSVDGASPQKDTSGGVPVTSELSIGRSNVVGGYLDGCITRIVYYPTAFTNEELQAATSA